MKIYKLYPSSGLKVSIENIFIDLINNYDQEFYLSVLYAVNKNLNIVDKKEEFNFLSQNNILEKFYQKDLELFFCEYIPKINDIYKDKIITSILNNKEIYNTYFKKIFGSSEIILKNLFSKIETYDFDEIIKICSINNTYSKKIMYKYILRCIGNEKLLKDLVPILNYIIKFELNLDLDVTIYTIKKMDWYRYLLKDGKKFKLCKNDFQRKKKIIGKIIAYNNQLGYYWKDKDKNMITINISNFLKDGKIDYIHFERLLITFFHEIKHCIQQKEKQNLIHYEQQRCKLLIELDSRAYHQYHDSIISEIDADSYAYENTISLLQQLNIPFTKRKYVMMSAKNIANYYEKLISYDYMIDKLVKQNPNILNKYDELKLEYDKNGNPYNIDFILNNIMKETNSSKVEKYNKILIRTLIRMNKTEYIEFLKNNTNEIVLRVLVNELKILKENIQNIKESFEKRMLSYSQYQKCNKKTEKYFNIINSFYIDFLNNLIKSNQKELVIKK